MKSSFNYRVGSINDFDQLKQLGYSSYSEFQKVLTPENWQKLSTGLENDEKHKELISKSKVLVCEDKGKIIGVGYLVPSGNPEGVFQEDWSFIRRVGVDPSYRGHGIAKKITELCIKEATASNEKILALHTSEFMDAARHIYESLGFKKVREIDPIFGKRYWLYLLNLG